MRRALRGGLGALLCALLAHLAPAQAASFDCQRARSKLNRLICSDAELSRLDELVWNAYGERIGSLTSLQYTHVRARHIQWRRSRGLYEATVEAIKHEYRAHLAWLTHPLLWLDGRYQRTGPGESTAHVEADIDTRRPDLVELRGLVLLAPMLPWHGTGYRAFAPTGDAAGTRVVLQIQPALAGSDARLADDCRFELAFDGDTAELVAAPACGRAFDGRYVRVAGD